MKGKRILLADDEYVARVVMRDRLVAEGFEILEAETGEEAVEKFRTESADLVLMDVNFDEGINGFEATRRIKALSEHRFIPVILCTVRDDLESKKVGLDYGADDYITKPFDLTELIVRVRSMLRIQELAENNDKLKERNRKLRERERKLREENVELRSCLLWPDWSEPIVGDSPAIQRVFRLVEKMAPSSEIVLVTGETGVGKALIARLIHHNSDQRSRSMLVLDCPSIPETLFESELFGHKKGAFSGAYTDRKGILVEGDGSTVFLDEIGEIPHGIQAKLLRFLQDNTVRQIGSNRARKVDVRIIAATNRDLETMVKRGEFREDLFYRLSVLRIHIPPLRERPEDIPALAHCFLAQFNEKHSKSVREFTPEALRELERISFSGNVRQLKNIVVLSAVLATDGEPIDLKHLSEAMTSLPLQLSKSENGEAVSLRSITEDAERRVIQEYLERYQQDRTRTAKALGMTRQGLWKKMKKLGL